MSFQLSKYLGENKDNFEKWSSGLGMFPPKKKSLKNATTSKDAVAEDIIKSKETFEKLFINSKWD